MTAVWSVTIGLALLVVFLGMLVVGLLQSHAEILRRLDKLGVRLDDDSQGPRELASIGRKPIQTDVSDIVGVDTMGEPVVVSPLVGNDPTLIAFLSTTCSSCTVFWESFDRSHVTFGDRRYRVVVVTLGEGEESPTRANGLRKGSAEVVMSSDAWSQYEVPGAPYFVLIDPSQSAVIGEGTSSTVDALKGFLADSAGDLEWDQTRASLPDRTDQDREAMIDEELRRAGLEPGDPRLYHGREHDHDD